MSHVRVSLLDPLGHRVEEIGTTYSDFMSDAETLLDGHYPHAATEVHEIEFALRRLDSHADDRQTAHLPGGYALTTRISP